MGKDFSTADKGKTFKRGGEMATRMDPKMMAMMAAKKRGAGKPGMGAAPAMPRPPAGGMGGGMGMMKKGGLAAGHKAADGVASKGKTKGTMVKMNKGGKAR